MGNCVSPRKLTDVERNALRDVWSLLDALRPVVPAQVEDIEGAMQEHLNMRTETLTIELQRLAARLAILALAAGVTVKNPGEMKTV
jgi:hypothetical protein